MAVMIKNIRKRTACNIQGIVLFLVLCGVHVAVANPRGCELVKLDVQNKGFTAASVNDRPILGSICEQETCCNADLQRSMYKQGQMHLDKYLKESITKISSLINNRAIKFDEIFREMMNNSKREFHEMFERTYGKIYLQNSDVFSDFFNELEVYYKKGTVRLSETMDTFFAILYQRMFTVINGQYNFNETYLLCVGEHMAEMKPFGDVPHKLGVQLRRSFVATRTFYKALVKGAESAAAMVDLKVDDECNKELMKMQYCGLCKGEQGAGACSAYCEATLQRCLSSHTEFNAGWDSFIDAIEKVAERLAGPYNIEMVVEPLNIKISEAIMNFQENGAEVSKRIYQKCGKPMLNRPKRKAEYTNPPEDNPNYEVKPIKSGGRKKHKKVEPVEDNTPNLEKLIHEIRSKIRDTKQFWLQLPYQYCNIRSASPSESANCWNGTSLAPFEKPDESLTSKNNRQIPLIEEQTHILKGLTDKLRKAHQGQEVELIDDTEEPFVGSGSGSGDGGDFDDDEGGDDDDFGMIEHTNNNVNENVKVNVPEVSSTTTMLPDVPRVVHSGAEEGKRRSSSQMSLTRALVSYLLPIVLAWFGGAIADLL